MSSRRHTSAYLGSLALAPRCVSAGSRLNEGIRLEAQGRGMQGVGGYADAIERDPELAEARARILPAGDSAIAAAVELLECTEVELDDGRPRAAHGWVQVRRPIARDTFDRSLSEIF